MRTTRRDVLAGTASLAAFVLTANLAAASTLNAATRPWIYTSRGSYRPGEAIACHVSASVPEVRIRLIRLGAEDELVFDEGGFPAAFHETPANASEEGCGWPVAFEIPVSESWRSGYYRLQMVAGDAIAEHCVIIRAANPGTEARIVMALSMNTMHAYNWWGGKSLYEAVNPEDIRAPGVSGAGRSAARWVSTQRPYAPGLLLGHPDSPRFPNSRPRGFEEMPFYEGVRYVMMPGYSRWDFSAGYQDKWEHHLVRWLERAGHTIDFIDQSDMGREPGILAPYALYLTAGHNEYMSWEERDEVERFLAAGGKGFMMSGNHAFWQVRWEDEGTRMVCYKSSAAEDPAFTANPQRTTTYWAHPMVGRPETRMTGLTFARGGFANLGLATSRGSGGYTVYQPEHWALAGSDLHYGDILGAPDRLVGWEVDGCAFTFRNGRPVATFEDGAPQGMEIIAIAPATFERGDLGYPQERLLLGGGYTRLAQSLYPDDPDGVERVLNGHCAMVAFDLPDGGSVFNVGSCEWPYGLQSGDPFVDRITRNVLDRFLQTEN